MTVARKHIGFVLFAVACLALGGVFVRLSQTGPVTTGAYRSLFAIPLLLLVARIGRGNQVTPRGPISRSDHIKLALAGFFLAADLCLWNISFLYTTLAEANLLANLVPFVVAPISYFVFKEYVPAKVLIPGVLAVGGLCVLLFEGLSIRTENLIGDGLALATAVFYGLFLVMTKLLRDRLPATQIMVYVSAYGAAMLFVIGAIRGETLVPLDAWGWAVLALLALTSQIGGQTLLAHSVGYLPLQLASLFVLLQPVIAAGYSYVLFDETLTVVQILGIAVLLVSIYWAKIILEAKNVTSRPDRRREFTHASAD